MPNLKPGCVIEVRYKIATQNVALIKDWIFQCSEPVRWSEYRIIHPKMMGYTIVPHGYHDFAIRESRDLKQIFYGKALRYVGVNNAECLLRRYAVKDAPAVREEPYITTVSDYMDRMEVQLSGYAINGVTTQVLKDWPSLIEELLESDHFGEKIDDTGDVTDMAEKVTSGCVAVDGTMKVT